MSLSSSSAPGATIQVQETEPAASRAQEQLEAQSPSARGCCSQKGTKPDTQGGLGAARALGWLTAGCGASGNVVTALGRAAFKVGHV